VSACRLDAGSVELNLNPRIQVKFNIAVSVALQECLSLRAQVDTPDQAAMQLNPARGPNLDAFQYTNLKLVARVV
jgi:hypothetical protein